MVRYTDLQDKSRQFDKTNLKGKEEEVIVYQVLWEDNDDVTRIEIPESEAEEVKVLSMEFQGNKSRIASDDHRTFVIGRGVQSDLVCNTRLASRTHATIVFRRGKFNLSDQSSNGTYVATDDGENIHLRRNELMLWGSGYIGLGEEVSKEEQVDLIRFVCE